MKVLVAGAGIGGLTTALALRHFGHDADVFERAPELGEVGAGIQVPPNASRVLRALEVLGAVEAQAVRPAALEARWGPSGSRLFRIPIGTTPEESRWDAPYLHVHRADYVRALRARLDAPVHLGREAVGYEQGGTSVTLRFRDGTAATGDALVAADGLRSALRAQMHGPSRPRYTGHTAWRAVVPVSRLGGHAPERTATVWMGPQRHAVTYLLRGGRLANLVAVVERPSDAAESWRETGTRADALRDFHGWHPTITTLLREADRLHRWSLHDRPPLASWTDRRVALLGDAAHPMLPFMAQAAALAVEDAWTLASQLTDDVPASLLRYQQLRQPRAADLHRRSQGNAKLFHRPHPLLAAHLRVAHLVPELALRRLDPLYRWTPPPPISPA